MLMTDRRLCCSSHRSSSCYLCCPHYPARLGSSAVTYTCGDIPVILYKLSKWRKCLAGSKKTKAYLFTFFQSKLRRITTGGASWVVLWAGLDRARHGALRTQHIPSDESEGKPKHISINHSTLQAERNKSFVFSSHQSSD